jgi:hypothetical protein
MTSHPAALSMILLIRCSGKLSLGQALCNTSKSHFENYVKFSKGFELEFFLSLLSKLLKSALLRIIRILIGYIQKANVQTGFKFELKF